MSINGPNNRTYGSRTDMNRGQRWREREAEAEDNDVESS